MNRSASEPGVACTVKEGNNGFEFGDGEVGEVGDLGAVNVAVLLGAVREDADQVFHAL